MEPQKTSKYSKQARGVKIMLEVLKRSDWNYTTSHSGKQLGSEKKKNQNF